MAEGGDARKEAADPQPLMPPVLWLLLFVGAALMVRIAAPWAVLRFPGRSALALALAAAGVALALAGVSRFRRRGTTVDPTRPGRAGALVTDGVFGLTRNPMYLGMATILAGVAVATGSALALALPPLFAWALTRWQIRPEEAAMRRLFGEAFEAYAARVPRWVIR